MHKPRFLFSGGTDKPIDPKIQRYHKPRVPKYHTCRHPKGTVGPGHPSISTLATKLPRPDTLPPTVSPPTRVPRISVVYLINLASQMLMYTQTPWRPRDLSVCVLYKCVSCDCVSV